MIPYLSNYSIDIHGTIRNIKTGRTLKHYMHKGYPAITLTNELGKKKNYFIHRLIAEVYIPNPDNKPFVNHKDGDTTNYKIENLEWCTQKENLHHAKKLTGFGAVVSKKKLLELYREHPNLSVKEFLDVVFEYCN